MKKICKSSVIATFIFSCLIILGCSKETLSKNDNSKSETETSNRVEKSSSEKFALTTKEYGLSYNSEQVAVSMNAKGQVLVTAPSNKDSSLLVYLNECPKRHECHCSKLNPGLYEIVLINKVATLNYYSPVEGKIKVSFIPPNPKDPPVLVLGNLCGDAEGSILDLCERLVLCYRYELWCPW